MPEIHDRIQRVPIEQLRPAEHNPRVGGSVAELVASLEEFGQHRPLVVRPNTDGTYEIIAGNHLYEAARRAGWREVAVLVVDDDDRKAKRRAVADNATQDLSRFDPERLDQLLAEVGKDIPGLLGSTLAELDRNRLNRIEEDVEPTYPLVARPLERYDYVMIMCRDQLEWASVCTALKVDQRKRRPRKHKSKRVVGTIRVIEAKEFLELWQNK